MSAQARVHRQPNWLNIALLAILAVGLAGYLSQLQRMNSMGKEWEGLEDQIVAIETSFGPDRRTFMEGARSLEADYQRRLARLPPKDQEGIRLISDAAREYGMEVAAIQADSKALFLDDKQQQIPPLEGKACWTSHISMEVKGRYADLSRYLSALQDQFPVYVTVERMRVTRSAAGDGALDVSLDLNLYLLL